MSGSFAAAPFPSRMVLIAQFLTVSTITTAETILHLFLNTESFMLTSSDVSGIQESGYLIAFAMIVRMIL